VKTETGKVFHDPKLHADGKAEQFEIVRPIRRVLNLIHQIARGGVLASSGLAGLSALLGAPADQAGLVLANNAFAFNLLKQIASEQSAGNILISPYGVSSILQIVGEGAAGKTKSEMERVLHLTALAAPDAAWESLDRSNTNGQNGIALDLVSSIWYSHDSGLKPEFAARSADFFRAKLGALDFANPQSARIINDWADQNTHGRIKAIVQGPINPLTRIFLANAIYFKGRWAREFDKRATADRTFTGYDNRHKQVPMMRQRGQFAYFQTPEFQAVCLPYAGERLQMYIFLPSAASGIGQLLAGFDGATWPNKIRPRFRDREGTVMLPRFDLSYAVLLNQPLQALGIRRAFSPDADFSAMSDGKLRLSEVRQKSFAEVNEEGTEATAATTGVMHAMLAIRPDRPFEMIMDHPFFFVIDDGTTNSIFFMGVVSDPGAAE
jgi:serine protease inhibitor